MAEAQPVTVVLYTDSSEPSGMGEHMLALGETLHPIGGYKVLFACAPTPAGRAFLSRAEALGLAALPIAAPGELSALLKQAHIDVFHMHAGIGWEGHEGIYRARDIGVPAIIRTEHLPYLLTDANQQHDYAQLVGHVDRLICVSSEARDSFVRAGVPTDRIAVIRNGIIPTTAVAGHESLRAELGLPASSVICLTVGRMTEQKGHAYLLHAIAQVIPLIPHAYFLWVGTGPLEAELQEKARALDLYKTEGRDRIYFLGRRDDVPRLIASSALFVLPSLFEGLPLAVLEAMASGLPIVATNVTGTREAIEDGVSGRLVPPCDSHELASAIIEALTRPDLAETWGRNARQVMQTHFTAERMAHETSRVYREALAGI
ncbi:MAG: glycosyltransferase family 4 protein [Chloroflexia bacterium]